MLHMTEIYIRGASANERLMKFDASINQQRRASKITAADIRTFESARNAIIDSTNVVTEDLDSGK